MMKKRLFSVLYMFCLTLLFTSVVSAVHVLNRERITLNERIRLQEVVLHVLGIPTPPQPPATSIVEIFEARVKVVRRDGKTVYVGLSEDGGKTAGYAFPLFGPGFWGPIYGMVGVDPQVQTVLGIAFYEHGETPGLGGRITEPWFEGQFKGKRLAASTDRGRYFYLRPAGTVKGPNEVDAITGATGTSNKLEIFLDRNLKEYLPWIMEQKTQGVL